jgi:hypothetical protein
VFAAGDELVFALTVRQTGETFYSGPASRNFDGASHSSAVRMPDGTVVVGFEDLTGGGDQDFNDLMIALTGDLEVR